MTPIVSPTSGPVPPSSGCSNLLIDDWESQSRLTVQGNNALGQSSSDDDTMASIVVSGRKVMLTPKNTESYFYSQFGCLNVANRYGGISFRIRAARGTTFAVTLAYFTTCGSNDIKTVTLSTTQLRWTFDGTEKLYWFPFSVFPGLDTTKLDLVYFTEFNAAVIFGPMSFYCGTSATEWVPPTVAAPAPAPVSSITRPRQTTAPSARVGGGFLIDSFNDRELNALGEWHGGDNGLTLTFGNNRMTIQSNDSDQSWSTKFTEQCADMRAYANSYLHITYSGSNKFSVAMQQHNEQCNNAVAPFPETWDSLEAVRYASATDIYIPLSHFNINLTRSIGFNLRGFYTSAPTTLTRVEIVDRLPSGWTTPSKLPSGKLVFACTRPNSFALAIDDGNPRLAQRVMDIINRENVPVTFFTVGQPLLDRDNGLQRIYKDMAARGHQIALHSYTHPKMEGLADTAAIDWELTNDIGAARQVFGTTLNGRSNYFRPPYGNEGARMRQRLAYQLNDPNVYIVNWSIDVEDWIWGASSTPQRQLDAFKRGLAKGGNLVVMHYVHQSTVDYLPEFIKLAKASGKRLMRVDQCMMDPNAPPLK